MKVQIVRFTLMLFAINLISCADVKSNKPLGEEKIKLENAGINVRTSVVTKEEFNQQIITNGVVESAEKSVLRFKTSDQIQRIRTSNGSRVSKGEILAVLDNELLKSKLQKARIVFENAKQSFMRQKINFDLRDVPISEIKPSVLKTLYKNSGYKVAKNDLLTAEILYKQTILRAPFSGIVANLFLKEGNFITSADDFCTIISEDDFETVFYVMEDELPKIELGREVSISPFTSKEITYSGKIIEINPMVNNQGLIWIKAKLTNNNPEGIFDGMNVKVKINRVLKDVTVIPKDAVVTRSNKKVVFTAKGGYAKWNYIDIINENLSQYAVRKGVNPGDTIIISGNLNLTQNAKISPQFISESN